MFQYKGYQHFVQCGKNQHHVLQLYTGVHICKQGVMFDLSRVQGSGIFNSGSYVVFMKLFRFCKGISIVL